MQSIKILKESGCTPTLREKCLHPNVCFQDVNVVEKKVFKAGEIKHQEKQCKVECQKLSSCMTWTLQLREG